MIGASMGPPLVDSVLPDASPVLIVGAGPAGLGLSRQLARRNVPHVLLEAGRAGASWHAMPPALRLVSPWWTNVLAKRDVFRHFPFAMVGAEHYARYLARFRHRYRLNVTEHCEVLAISREGTSGWFRVETSRGCVAARMVVCATGYFTRPADPTPSYADDGSIPIMHAARYPGPEQTRAIAGDAPVVIVGRRISAGQLMVELHRHGVPVVLSTRAPLEFRRDGVFGAFKDFLYYFYEELLIRLKPRLQAPSFPVMDGGHSRHIVEAGHIPLRGAIRNIRGGEIEFDDGTMLRAGLVINATGYRPALPPLREIAVFRDEAGLPACHDWESADTPELFFLGLDNRVNYRSRTIRGIRRDASLLASLIERRLRSFSSQPPRA